MVGKYSLGIKRALRYASSQLVSNPYEKTLSSSDKMPLLTNPLNSNFLKLRVQEVFPPRSEMF
jgi:hypothetical protein